MAMKGYDQKFKEEALKLSDDIGLKKAREQLNLNYGTLSGWRKQRVRKNRAGKKSGDEAVEEIKHLQKEVEELRSAKEIPKDALVFFAKDRKR
jgi:transposase